ncbi:hypothetical protein L9F63_005038 [Diploptera punctata]|uniref:Ionotropic glutamate receptor C-terminal domain-containing protein n=1 Tax=Diploptera punctata TaxID=6984 RepID=A0AAD7ZDL4_DIPPU|nr:hypothetical protein L9F63_005038 [Diploptera punctata]
MGCDLNIGSFGTAPYVIEEYDTTEDGENKFVLEGIGMELINLFAKEKNFTPKYQKPTKVESVHIVKLVPMFTSGKIDIVGGFVTGTQPLDLFADFSVPFFIDIFKYIVPCPKPKKKMNNTIHLFSTSTWISMGFVFIFVGVLFWGLSNCPTLRNDFTGFNLLAQCFSAAWAVLLGVSVPQMPLSLGTRSLFIIYVWYCFAISTVFQAYFTTYLVEPGYEARLETLDDVMQAGLKFGYYKILKSLRSKLDFEELDVFDEKECFDINECIRSVMFNREIFAIAVTYFPSYLASVSGFHEHSKIVCFLDKSIFSMPMGAAVPKGHPLLDILNIHIRRCLEGGLLETYWSKLKHEVNLKANYTDEDSEFVVFSLTHLTPVFLLLFNGYILSLIMFASEIIHFIIKTKKKSY